VQLILRIPGVPSGGGITANRTRWLPGCALIAYAAILIRLVVFKAIPVVRIGHLRLKLAGPHTDAANFVPFKTIAPQLIGQGNRLIDMMNLIGSIFPFMPIGFFAPLVFRSISWQKILVLGVVTGLSFEVMERTTPLSIDNRLIRAVPHS
jgi:glycopeptide antibiotics resistance protein